MFKLFTFLLLFISFTTQYFPQTITIGTGTTNSYSYGPIYVLSATSTTKYSRDIAIYTAAEIIAEGGSAGSITKLRWNKSTIGGYTGGDAQFTIYMKNTTTGIFSASPVWATEIAGASMVYTSSTQNINTIIGWEEFQLSTPFNWDGTSNIEIFVDWYRPGNATAPIPWYYTAMGTGNYYNATSSSTSAAPTTITRGLNRPNIQMDFVISTQSYVSSTVTQNTISLLRGTNNQQVIGIQVVMDGATDPLNLTQFNLNTTGTTSVTDIMNAKIFMTGSSATFSDTNQYGTTVVSPNGSYLITGSQALKAGVNYFWLTYDIPVTAAINNLIDAQCTGITINGITRTPTETNPIGARQIKNPLTGVKTLGAGGDYASFSSLFSDLNILGVGTGGVTFTVSPGIYTESPLVLTATGTPGNPIIFQASSKDSRLATILNITGTTATNDAAFTFLGSDYVTFDGISLTDAGTSATDYVEYGFYMVGASATNGCQNNTIKNCTVTLHNSNVSSRGILLSSSATEAGGANSNNKFYNNHILNTYYGYYFTGTSTSYDLNNEIGTSAGGTSIINTFGGGASDAYGIYLTYQTGVKIFNNLITNGTTTGSNYLGGIYINTGAQNTSDIYSNEITSLSNSYYLYGIYLGTSSTTDDHDIYSNTVHALLSTYTIYSIYIGDGGDVYNNTVYDINSTTATTYYVYGLYLGGGNLNNIYNNFIYDLKAATATSTSAGVRAIYLSAGSIVNISHNTVYLDYTATVAANRSLILYISASPDTVNLNNNIFVNNTNISAGTSAVVIWRSSSSNTVMGKNSNNNLYYAGIPGPKNLIHYDGTNSDQTMANYKARIFPKEQGSFSENPHFLSSVAPYNLHIDNAIATEIESGGLSVNYPITITTDFDGNIRNTLTPDIGADEFAGIRLDNTAPSINYTPLTRHYSTSTVTISNISITDPSNVNVTSGIPRLYYKRLDDENTFNDNTPFSDGWKYVETENTGSPFSFTLDLSNLYNGSPGTGDVIQYFIIAADMNTSPHIGINSGIFENPPSSVELDVSNFPIAGTINSFLIVPTLSGVRAVGPGETFTNLTQLANDLNGGNYYVNNNVVFELSAAYTETIAAPIIFNEPFKTDASYTITIRPAAAATLLITSGDPGSGSTNAVIDLNGVGHFTLDGRAGGVGTIAWTIRNTRTATTVGPVIRLVNGAAYNTFQYLNLESQAISSSTGVVFFNTTTGNSGNSNNTISNCNIRNRSDVAGTSIYNAIYNSGTATAPNSNNTISNNNIFNFSNNGIYLTTAAGGGWIISGNHLFNEITGTSAQYGIYHTSALASGTLISNNYIGGNAPFASGTWSNSGNVTVVGVYITGGTATISGNTIANFSSTNIGTGTRIKGISTTTDNDTVYINNNTIYNLATSGTGTGLAGGSVNVMGIYAFPGGYQKIIINGNTIYNISMESTTASTTSCVAAGIVATNLSGIIRNNKIYNIKNKNTGNTVSQPPIAAGIYTRFLDPGNVYNNMISLGTGEATNTQFAGIMVTGGLGGTHNYSFNSVVISGTTAGDISSFAFLRGDNTAISVGHPIVLKNNLLVMERSGGTSVNYVIGNQGTAASSGWTSDYNILYNSPAASQIGFWDAAGYDFTGWKTVSVHDAHSKSKIINFVDIAAGDLHLTGTSNGDFELTGTPISGITTDYDSDTRNVTAPYMGADESTTPLPVELGTFNVTAKDRDAFLNWETKMEVNTSSFEVERSSEKEEWKSIGHLNAAGNSNSPVKYTYRDKKLNTGKYSYRLKMIDKDGSTKFSQVVETEIAVPTVYNLSQNYPNPFNPSTKIDYQLPVDARVTLELYSITGERVAVIVNTEQAAGYYTLDVNSSVLYKNLASGVYIYRMYAVDKITGNNFVNVKKMMMLK